MSRDYWGLTDKTDQSGPAEKLRLIRKRIDSAATAENANRLAASEDMRFLSGEHWPQGVRAQRDIDQRPCLTSNRLKTFWHQITNDQRQNRPTIRAKTTDRQGHPEVAKIFDGWFRRTLKDCDGDIAIDTGFEQAVAGGWGYWRVYTDHESEDGFEQIIGLAKIANQFTVYKDPDSVHPTAMDARWIALSWQMDKDEFEEKWPDAAPIPLDTSGLGEDQKPWISGSQIRVAEYYSIESEPRTLVSLDNGHTGWKDLLDDRLKADIEAHPERVKKEREVDVRRVKCCVVNALEVLEEYDIPGTYIPIVMISGDAININGRTVLSGIVRDAKDSQRMYNYWLTAGTERIALAPLTPYIMAAGQDEGFEQEWETSHLASRARMRYRPITAGGQVLPPPMRTPPVDAPTGIIQFMQIASEDLKATTGIRFDATISERMQDESGIALQELRKSGDMGSFHYQDNLHRSLVQTGRIMLGMFPEIYDTERELTVEYEDGKEEVVIVDPALGVPYQERQVGNGKTEKRFNPRIGRYDVQVVAGPSYTTKREAAAESQLAFLKIWPAAAPMIADLLAKNLEWDESISRRFAKMLPPQLAQPDQKDMPPQVMQAFQHMQQQMQQMQQQNQQLNQALAEKQELLKQGQSKIDRDFQAKVMSLQEKLLEKEMGQKHDMNMARFEKLLEVLEQQYMPKQPQMVAGSPGTPAGGPPASRPAPTGGAVPANPNGEMTNGSD
jgi:hypothetical protein